MKLFANWKYCYYKHSVAFFSLFLCLQIFGQDIDSELSKFAPIIQALDNFSKNVPHEKVYLHFDNTSYYQGDHIWFKCYIVTSGQHQLSQLSKTLYVELLNPGGEIINKRTLKIENGQCHGEFTLNQLPFYSGFYEVRAYTKYMLNFGNDVIFSRLLPVFDKPKVEGNFEEKEMLPYGRWGVGNYPMKRERPLKEKKVNLRFFPEGGHLIQGVQSHVAFEATDEAGNPIDVTGVVTDGRDAACRVSTMHEGRGVFLYTPTGVTGRQRDIAEVEYSGKKYKFDLPACLPQGVVMEVDNLSNPDSIGISLRKNENTPAEMLGIVILSGGKMQRYSVVWMEDDEFFFKLDKTCLPSGVSQVVLFNSKGEILCDRLIFVNRNENLIINVETRHATSLPRPHELVDLEITVADREENPVQATFSLSVRDGKNEVEGNHNILTDLLLMSEIKGYVRNPSFYFEEKNNTVVETRHATSLQNRHAALDQLLMVQGWRRYSWKQMAGTENFDLKYLPEQGIEIHGQVVNFNFRGRQVSKPNVNVVLLLQNRNDDEGSGGFINTFVTDDQGRFSFVSDVSGRWNMILSVKEKGKKKDNMILLDRVFTPDPKRYNLTDLQISITEKNIEHINDEETTDNPEVGADAFDVFTRLSIDEKIHHIPEVTIRAKRRTREMEIFHNRSTSVAYYDVNQEYDNIYDKGKFVGKDIHQLLINMNEDFSIIMKGDNEFLTYKNRLAPLFVINYNQQSEWNLNEYFKYKNININAIKSIYINESLTSKCEYANKMLLVSLQNPCIGVDRIFSCVVFIETYPEDEIPADDAKGVRKTWLEGYSPVREFYSPNYSDLPPAPDYRRTLYWNPMVIPDENGKAKINFYNNSSCTSFSISAETVTKNGLIGWYKSN